MLDKWTKHPKDIYLKIDVKEEPNVYSSETRAVTFMRRFERRYQSQSCYWKYCIDS